MTEDEKRNKIIRALIYALEEKKQGTLAELVSWLKGVTPLKMKNLVLAKAQSIANQTRGDGEGLVTEADEEDSLVSELQTEL